MKTGIEIIAEERLRQINEEGWTEEHDDNHKATPDDRIRELEKAVALIAAEIDRLEREQKRQSLGG